MRMEIVVNDTNILIDLYESGLLKYCDAVKLEFHTLDMIVEEVEEVNLCQGERIQAFDW